MSSFVDEFKKYQKQERWLTGVIVSVSFLAPLTFTILLDKKAHWLISSFIGLGLLLIAMWAHIVRRRVADKVLNKYESLGVGSVLAKKITMQKSRRFVVTNRGYNHFYLKCLNTGEQVLVPKHRVREDFDIAN